MIKMHIFKFQQHLHQNLVLFLSILKRFLLRGLFIHNFPDFIQHFICKNMVKMHIFKGWKFLSPLQQHLQTPKLMVLFISIFWSFLYFGFVYISFTLINTTYFSYKHSENVFVFCLLTVKSSLEKPLICQQNQTRILFLLFRNIYIYTGAGHIIRISSKSWFISLIPFKKWNLYNVYIHSTQTDIFQVFISFNFDDYKWQLMKTPNSVSQKIRILWKGSILKTPGATL